MGLIRSEKKLKILFRNLGFSSHATHYVGYYCGRNARCQKRRTLLRKGHVAYSVYFVFSGAVSVDYDPDDHSLFAQKKLITLRKGAVFGVSQECL